MIYIHVPFCHRKCTYCAFYSVRSSESGVRNYVDALIEEMRQRCREQNHPIKTIYFGGGTPSILPLSELVRIVEALGRHGGGMTRDEIAQSAKLSPCGTFTRYLDDLEKCGFISRYRQFGSDVKGAMYCLSDNYTLFYFQFVAENIDGDPHFWTDSLEAPFRRTWTGFAYERLCLKHIPQIKAALGIAGVRTSVASWSHRADERYPEGAQIDLLLDRSDGVINVCEMKFSPDVFLVDAKTEEGLMRKLAVFSSVTGTRKAVHLTMVTPFGILRNAHSGRVQSEVTLADLFK